MSDAVDERYVAMAAAHLIDRRGRCRLAYEPVADLARGTICGYEAVTRFSQAVDPEDWRVEAVRRGLEPDLDAFMVASVLEARESLPPDCFLSFNIAAETLVREPVQELLARADPLDALIVELSPRVDPDLLPRLLEAVAVLRRAGAKIAVDHVGGDVGVLAASAVRPEFVKLHPRLVAGVHRDETRRALVEGIGELASRFDSWVVAQGVEQIEQLDALMALRVPLAQGPLIGVAAKTLTPVAFSLSAYVREHGSALAAPGPLAGLLQRAPSIERSGDPRVVAMALSATFGGHPGLRYIAVVDDCERPVGMAEWAAHQRGEPPLEEVLVVSLSARVPDVALRAMARPPETRFHPVVCCGQRGRYLGIVPVERLVAVLAAARDDL